MSTDLEYNYEEALQRQKFSDSDVNELREKIKKFENVPKTLSARKLLCFLNACNGTDDAANVISAYYEIRQTCPSIFSNRDPLSAEVQQCLSNQYYFHLPNTPAGHSVIYHSLSNPKASNYVFDEACKTFFMTIDSLLYSRGPSNGLIIVFNMQNVVMRHLMRTNIAALRTFFRYLQDALPANLEAMHIINCVSFFDTILALIKPFMKSEIIQKMHLHHGKNYEEFQKIVPKSSLPFDLGGDLKSAEQMHNEHIQEFTRLRNFFVEDEKEAKLIK